MPTIARRRSEKPEQEAIDHPPDRDVTASFIGSEGTLVRCRVQLWPILALERVYVNGKLKFKNITRTEQYGTTADDASRLKEYAHDMCYTTYRRELDQQVRGDYELVWKGFGQSRRHYKPCQD